MGRMCPSVQGKGVQVLINLNSVPGLLGALRGSCLGQRCLCRKETVEGLVKTRKGCNAGPLGGNF